MLNVSAWSVFDRSTDRGLVVTHFNDVIVEPYENPFLTRPRSVDRCGCGSTFSVQCCARIRREWQLPATWSGSQRCFCGISCNENVKKGLAFEPLRPG